MKRSLQMTGSPTLPAAPAPADTRQKLLEAAGVVFAEHGFHQATVRQITDRAGTNLAAVNYHFRDKAELYAAVMRECFCTAADRPELDAAQSPEIRLHGWISRFVREKFGAGGPSWHHQLMAREMQEPTPALAALVEERICPEARELEGIIRGLHDGPLTQDQVYLMGFSIVGQILHYLSHAPLISRIYPPFGIQPPDVRTLTEHIYQFSLAALTHYPKAGKARKRKP
jgi:TetR/AcrR family transcriptional regulator, regulator of cefoperazone and chloramphenicol sensitivity